MSATDPLHKCPKCEGTSLTITKRLETYQRKAADGKLPGKDDLVSTTIHYQCDSCGCAFKLNLEEC